MFCGMCCVRRVMDLRWRMFLKAVTGCVLGVRKASARFGVIYNKV